MNAEHDTTMFEKIKDEEERLQIEKDVRGSIPSMNPSQRSDSNLELLATIALQNERATRPPPPPAWEPITATVTNVSFLYVH